MKITELDPGLHNSSLEKINRSGGKLVNVNAIAPLAPDVVFAALPHLMSGKMCEEYFGNAVVVDLSADFRIRNAEDFCTAYGENPPCPDYQGSAVYGLSEVYRSSIREADIIANPGCYPTATLLPLIPFLKAGYVQGPVVINALSGISGAGKKAKENLLFSERTENAGAYAPGKSHRHAVEIQQEINCFNSSPATIDAFFTPHLVPLKRGMVVTTAFTASRELDASVLDEMLNRSYENDVFIKCTGERIPQSRDVWGSNRCDIGRHAEGRTVFLFSAIDNLVKGASGQAVQNMNIRFGFDETAGLPVTGEL